MRRGEPGGYGNATLYHQGTSFVNRGRDSYGWDISVHPPNARLAQILRTASGAEMVRLLRQHSSPIRAKRVR